MVLAVAILMFAPGFILYFILPTFVFFTVFTVAVRERDRHFPIREIMQDICRLALWR